MKFGRMVIIFLLIVVFLAAGGAKLAQTQSMIDQFAHFQLPLWFMTLTGAIEVIGAVAVATPVAFIRKTGAFLLASTMLVGATFHFRFDPPLAAMPAIILAFFCLLIFVFPTSDRAKLDPRNA